MNQDHFDFLKRSEVIYIKKPANLEELKVERGSQVSHNSLIEKSSPSEVNHFDLIKSKTLQDKHVS